MRKLFLYKCASTFSALNYCSGIFFLKSLSYLYKVGRTNFSADFCNFWQQVREKIVASPWDENTNCNASERPMTYEKKQWKQDQNRPINRDTVLGPLGRTARRRTGAWRKKRTKHHIFEPTAGARCSTFPKLCMVIEYVETIKKDVKHFLIQCSFSYRVHGKFWGKWLTRSFSAVAP